MTNNNACGGFCGVHVWQNGTRCRDGVKVLWWHSHLVWLVFEGSIPICACLHLASKIYCNCVCCFSLFDAVIGSLSNLASHKLLEVHMSRALISCQVLQTDHLVASVTVSEPHM